VPGPLIGALRVSLSLETAAFEKGADYAQKRAAALGKRMQATGDRLVGIGTKMSIGLTAPFAALLSKAIPAAIESREALGQVNAALASMGPVAGKTAAQLQKAATQLESLSTFDDDDILKKVTANMLTFGNISGQAFDRAQLAAVNLSARLGQDLQSSAIQVGKALNDPIKGLQSLSRVGIQFTEAQKAMIKNMVETGNMAGAQGIILGELERQFGGAAAAARKASPTADMQQAWRNFQETVGEMALKVLPPLTSFLTRLVGIFNGLSPATQTWVIGIVALSAALGPVLLVLGSVISIGGQMIPLIMGLTKVWAALKVALVAARIAALATLPALVPFLIPLAALAAAVGAVYLAWKHWDKITAVVARMVSGVTGWLKKLAAPFNWVRNQAKVVGDAFLRLYDRVVGHSYIPDMVDEIGDHMGRLQDNMVAPAQAAVAATEAAFAGMDANGPATMLERLPTLAEQANAAMKNVAMDGIRSLAEGLTAVVMGTAKLGDMFRQVAQQIIAELIRIQIQKMLMQVAGSLFGMPSAGAGIPGLATGGPVMSGRPYIVGERGPELFMPRGSGEIIPNHALGGGKSPVNIYMSGPMSDRQARQTGMQAAAAYKSEIARSSRNGFG
jgi:hypothetical protein